MYRNNQPVHDYAKFNIVLNHAALGDAICSLPAVVHARHSSPLCEMLVWAPSYQLDLISLLLFPYGDFTFRRLEDFKSKASERDPVEDGPVVINAVHTNQFTRNRVSLVDYAFAPICDAWPENDEQRSYTTEAPIGKRKVQGPYIVIPVNSTSDNKLFHAKVLGPVLEWIVEEGYKPVILGKSDTQLHALGPDGATIKLEIRSQYDQLPESLRAQCLDLRDKLTLVQARDVCGHASALVGVDGGTIHLAATTDVPIVYCLTTTLPVHRSIVRHGKPNWKVRHVTPKDLACSGCQSNWRLVVKHDYRGCWYDDNKCVEMLDPNEIIAAIQQLGVTNE